MLCNAVGLGGARRSRLHGLAMGRYLTTLAVTLAKCLDQVVAGGPVGACRSRVVDL